MSGPASNHELAPMARGAVGKALGAHAWRLAGVAAEAVDGRRWPLAFALAGALPLLLACWLPGRVQQVTTAVAVFLLLLAAVRAQRPAVAVLGVGIAFAVHSLLAIVLAANWPDTAARLMPDGAAYWQAQQQWIASGQDPEYEPGHWLPHHAQLMVGMLLLGVVSLGLLPLVQGVYEVDLMNYYVGSMLAAADEPVRAALFGWHPWSICRGVCFAFVVHELASLTLQWLTGRRLATAAARRRRLLAALLFFAADAGLKYGMIGIVRDNLHDALTR